MALRSISEAREVLSKHESDLLQLIHSAYAKYLDQMGPMLKVLETRTKRGAVRDFIIDEIWPWAEKTPNVQPFKRGNLKWIGFENNWIVRAKWLNESDGVGVSPTEASKAFDRNEIPAVIQRTLLNDEPATALYLGWRTNENTPTVPEISFVCNNSSAKPEWIWRLGGEVDPKPDLTLPLPEIGGPSVSGVRIKVRDGRKVDGTG